MTDRASEGSTAGRLYVGTSGYHYDHWRDVLYPAGLAKKQWFSHYAARFDTVEINNTFYSLPGDEKVAGWREQAPPGFRFALKLSRYATHMKKLKDPEEPLERFLAVAEGLGARLGPILVQLPPQLHHSEAHEARLARFLEAAPRRHRWVIELRDRSWLRASVYRLLNRHDAVLCVHDLLEDHPREVPASFTYQRFHGLEGGQAYQGRYSRRSLAGYARRFRRLLRQGTDVYAYFNNDAHGYAVINATELRRAVETGSTRG